MNHRCRRSPGTISEFVAVDDTLRRWLSSKNLTETPLGVRQILSISKRCKLTPQVAGAGIVRRIPSMVTDTG